MSPRPLALSLVSGLCASIVAPAPPAAAQSFTNGTFNTSLSGLSVLAPAPAAFAHNT
jgi:hypothetical protein